MNKFGSTYTYGNSAWKDLLTGYTTGGHTYAVTYDGAGHPLNYLGAAMTWDNAGNLASMQKGSNPFLPSATSSVSYTYLANGQRRTKTVGSNTTSYRYNNGLLLSQKTEATGSSTGTTAETLSFTYDADGKPVSITYKQGSNAAVTYFYAYNGQGDVIALYNSSNSTLVGSYEYDLWGKLISATPASSTSDPNGILTKNPFRYRGYYYDNETGYYYLNARYYDPQVRRFISADSLIASVNSAIQGYNLFSYSFSNPVNMTDDSGNCPFFVVSAVALGVLGAVAGGIYAASTGGNILAGVAIGAAAGALIGTGVGMAAGVALAGSALATTAQVGAGLSTLCDIVNVGGVSAGAIYVKYNVERAEESAFYLLDQMSKFTSAKINHLINGSRGRDHHWDTLVPNKCWDDIKNIIVYALQNGAESPYKKTAFQRVVNIDGHDVTVTFQKMIDGAIKIGDAWVD